MAINFDIFFRGHDSNFQAAAQRVKKVGDSLASSFARNAGAALLGGLSLAGISQAIRASTEFGAHIGDLSKRTGIGVERLQELDFAARTAGSSLDDIVLVIQKLSVNQVEALKGNSDIVQSFARLGVSLSDLRKMRAEDLFVKIASHLDGIRVNSLTTSDAIATMGKSAGSVLPAMTDGLAKAVAQAQKLKIALSESEISELKGLDDKLAIMSMRARSKTAGAVSFGLEAVNTAGELAGKANLPEHAEGLAMTALGGSGLIIKAISQYLGKKSVERDLLVPSGNKTPGKNTIEDVLSTLSNPAVKQPLNNWQQLGAAVRSTSEPKQLVLLERIAKGVEGLEKISENTRAIFTPIVGSFGP